MSNFQLVFPWFLPAIEFQSRFLFLAGNSKTSIVETLIGTQTIFFFTFFVRLVLFSYPEIAIILKIPFSSLIQPWFGSDNKNSSRHL